MKKFVKLLAAAAALILFASCEKPVSPQTPSEPDTPVTPAQEQAPFKLKVYDVSSVTATVEVEPSASAVQWWSYIALEDLTDRSREVIIKNVLFAPTEQGLTRQLIVAYWGVNTIMGVAQDADGAYGELLLKVIDLNKEGVSPASELVF